MIPTPFLALASGLVLESPLVVIRERWLLVVAGLIIGMLVVLSWTLWRINRRQRLFRKLLIMRTTELAKQSVELQLTNEKLEQQQKILERQRDQLDFAFRELTELNRFKQNLVGMIVHDLKNPLNTILMLSQIPVDEANRRSIHNAGRQMLNLVLNILDIQRFEETVVKPKSDEVELLPWLREVVGEVALSAANRGIRIFMDVAPDLRATFDREMIARVLVNILTNAIKYSPYEGEVYIVVQTEASGDLLVSVRDQGPGIAPEHLELIFQKFGQAQAREMGAVRSSGLGLTFCRLAVEAHGGQIWVESELGQGSVFKFRLPNVAASGSATEPLLSEAAGADVAGPELTNADREALKPVVARLRQIPFYETGLIIQVLDFITDTDSPTLAAWRDQLEVAVFAGNEARYQRLIQLAETNPAPQV